jgi:glutaconate CoA-transferase subunit B
MTGAWTAGEMLAVAAAAQVRDEDVVVVGLGLPQVAAALAKLTHAPGSTLMLEIGVFAAEPAGEAMGIADPRMWAGCQAFGGMLDVLGRMLEGGRITLGLLGALQVDSGGSINSSLVVEADGSRRRFRGSGGANDIASTAGRTVVVARHESRKFREVVDFVTSPGLVVRGRPRADLGLGTGGTAAVVTDRAVISIHADGAILAAVHPGESVGQVVDATSMPLRLPPGGPGTTPAPTPEQLELLRTRLDPNRWYTQ